MPEEFQPVSRDAGDRVGRPPRRQHRESGPLAPHRYAAPARHYRTLVAFSQPAIHAAGSAVSL